MAAALGYRLGSPASTDRVKGGEHLQARLCFHLQPGSYDTDSLITVLTQLRGFYAGEQVVLLWDGLGPHRSHAMHAWLDIQRDWLTVQPLPAYSPMLNPVEYLWANLKGAELVNYPGDTIAQVAEQACQGIRRVCASDTLVAGFLAHAGLTLDQPSP